MTAFRRFAWFTLGYNLFVVLWGAFVRASGSGAGCGDHWPLCNGVVMPQAPEIKTVIEFTHRVTSGIALLLVAVLAWWAWRRFERGALARRAAVASLVLIIVEALLGAGLVLLRYVEQNASAGRAVYLSAHLVNTMLLLGALTVTAWAAGRVGVRFAGALESPMQWCVAAALLAGVTGAIAALGDTLYPASSVVEGMKQDFFHGSPTLLKLRLIHPLAALAAGAAIAWAALRFARGPRGALQRTAWFVVAMVFVQWIAGVVNILILAPVWMQILHLLLAQVLWIGLVVLAMERVAAGERVTERPSVRI
jgi:heme A synthase